MPKKRSKTRETPWRRRLFPALADVESEQQVQQQELDALELYNIPPSQSVLDHYKDYPLARSMLQGAATRNQTLEADGRKQGDYVQSNDGWIKTLLVIEGRALDNIAFPWIVCTTNAIFWTLLNEYALNIDYGVVDSWEFFISFVVNTSLSFLLVFRLNRAAERYWLARECWGTIVGDVRHLVGGIEVHGGHDPENRDLAIRWTSGYLIATMQYMRGIPDVPSDMLAGILSPQEVNIMASAPHPPLYASNRVRAALTDLFQVKPETPPGIAHAWTQQLDTLEKSLNNIMDQQGSMERIRATPLPLVYVTHLRIFLLIFLLSLPYIWYPSWRWSTIPIVFVTAFAMLGLEGTAVEVECPFRRDRPNHLDMDAFCRVALGTIQQTVCDAANRVIQKRKDSVDGKGGAVVDGKGANEGGKSDGEDSDEATSA